MLEQFLTSFYGIPAGLVGGGILIVVTEALKRILVRILPYRKHVEPRLLRLREAYLNIFRRFTPDSWYKLWLETGIMDEESYREYQRRGYIKDDLDPKYIQRTYSEE